MKPMTIKAIEKFKTTSFPTQEQLERWIKIFWKEIAINESCKCRVDDTEKELKTLYYYKCKCQQKLIKGCYRESF